MVPGQTQIQGPHRQHHLCPAMLTNDSLSLAQIKFCFIRLYTQSVYTYYVHACSVMPDSATPWTVVHQSPLSMGFPRQESWNGLPFPSPEDLLDAGIKRTSLGSPALAGSYFTTVSPGKLYLLNL